MSSAHLSALLRKNYIVWKRAWCCSLLEILLPVIFGLILSSFRGFVDIENLPDKHYINEVSSFSPNTLPPFGLFK